MTSEHTPPADPGVLRGRATTLPPVPTDYVRLELLYEIQTVLAQQLGVQRACDELLPIVTRTLRVRTAVVLDTSRQLHRVLVWSAEGIAPDEVTEARVRAARMFAYLGGEKTSSARVVARAALLRGGVADPAVDPRHFVTLPLSLGQGHLLGVFQLEAATAFDERDLLFINAVTSQLAVALDRHNVRLELETTRSEVERANRRLEDLHGIAKAAIEGATLDDSLSAALRAMCTMFETDVAAVLLVSADGKTLHRRASVGLIDAEDTVSVGDGASGRIAAAGVEMAFEDLDGPDSVSPALRSQGVRSMIGAPLRARNHLTGVVCVASRAARRFSASELQLLELVAGRIATVIDNATLYEHALAAIRSRNVVMGVVSHDLRNPLSAIEMCTELVGMDAPELTKPVTIIKRSVAVMDRLIGDLRDVANIEAGHLSIKLRDHDSRALVREAIDSAQAAASEKSIRLEARLPAEALAVKCDRDRIIQVLTNLLSNAIKFTPVHGAITVTLAEADAAAVRISVEDTGSGIPADDLPHVFGRYWQAKETAHLGTGLGLTITKGIVDAHGGTISVESRVGHGTTFAFTLPRASPTTP